MTSLLELRMRGARISSRWIEISLSLFSTRLIFNLQTPFRTPKDHFQHTSSTIREANEAVRSAATKQSAKRGSYAKFTPEQQAEVAKYASMHGMVVTSHHRFHRISIFHDNRYAASPLESWEVYNYTCLASYPGHFLRGRKKRPGTICLRMRQITQNLGNSDTRVYFQCTSIVVFRCMSVYVHVWGYVEPKSHS